MVKNLRLKHLSMENFKGVGKLSIDFEEDRAVLFGMNAAGKTTAGDAYSWVLFGKNLEGKSDFTVRPNDEDGNAIDNIVIKVSAVLDADGKEIVLTKTQKQDWVKRRNSGVAELQGNTNEYEINEIPKSEKDYGAYINSLIDEKVFKLITSTRAFTALPWTGQREALLELISEITNSDVIKTDAKFAELEKVLEDASVEDLTAKTKKALKGLKDTQKELPSRIDEASRAIVEVDLTEREQLKTSLQEQMVKVDEQLENASAAGEVMAELQAEMMQAQRDIGKIEQDANETIVSKRREVRDRKNKADDAFRDAVNKHSRTESEIRQKKEQIEVAAVAREKLLKDYGDIMAKELDADSLLCSMCGQMLPEDQKEQQTVKFEEHKEQDIESITERGKAEAANIKRLGEEIKELETLVESCKAEKIKQNGVKMAITAELESLSGEADLSGNKKHIDLTKKLADLKEQLKQSDTGEGYRSQLKQKKAELQTELNKVNAALASKESNERSQKRIEELQTEQKDVAKKVANQEKGLSLLEEFTRAKMDMLSRKINSKFKVVKFRLFKNQINGGYKDTCEAMVNGVGFNGDLNNGHRVIGGLDIISTLQEKYGVKAPIFVDNQESVNDFNLPDMGNCQMILLKVTDDREINIKGGTINANN